MLFLLFGTSSVPNAKLLVIAQSLLSPRVKKWKSVNICRSYWQLSTWSFSY